MKYSKLIKYSSNLAIIGLLGLLVSCGAANTGTIQSGSQTSAAAQSAQTSPKSAVTASGNSASAFTQLVASLDTISCTSSNQDQLIYSQADLGFFYCASDNTWTSIDIKGDKGETGASGVAGTAGANGTNGIDGTNGVDGATGATGAQGTAGANGSTVMAVYSASPNTTLSASITVNYASVTVFSDGTLYFAGEIIYYGTPYPMNFYIGSNKASTSVVTQLNLLIPGNNVLVTTNNANAILSGLSATGSSSTTVVYIGTAAPGSTSSSNVTAIGLSYQSGQ